MTKPKILLGLPTMGSIHTLLLVVISSWIAEAATTGDYNLSLYPTLGVQPVDKARNHIVDIFLGSDCTHLLFIDSDTIPPKNTIMRLLGRNKDIVSGLTPIIEHDSKRYNDSDGFYKKWNAVTLDNKFTEPNVGVIPVQGVGSSCILIRREVFEKMPKPWYNFLTQDDNGKEVFVGEDIHFIIKAKQLGFEAWCDTSVICGHNKPIIWK